MIVFIDSYIHIIVMFSWFLLKQVLFILPKQSEIIRKTSFLNRCFSLFNKNILSYNYKGYTQAWCSQSCILMCSKKDWTIRDYYSLQMLKPLHDLKTCLMREQNKNPFHCLSNNLCIAIYIYFWRVGLNNTKINSFVVITNKLRNLRIW